MFDALYEGGSIRHVFPRLSCFSNARRLSLTVGHVFPTTRALKLQRLLRGRIAMSQSILSICVKLCFLLWVRVFEMFGKMTA